MNFPCQNDHFDWWLITVLGYICLCVVQTKKCFEDVMSTIEFTNFINVILTYLSWSWTRTLSRNSSGYSVVWISSKISRHRELVWWIKIGKQFLTFLGLNKRNMGPWNAKLSPLEVFDCFSKNFGLWFP